MEPEQCKLVALFIIHSAGVILAFVSVLHLRLQPFTNLGSGLLKFMMWTVAVVAIVTLILILLTPGVGTSLWELREKPVPSVFANWVTFRFAVSVCAVIDLLGLAILIGATGGPSHSMYFPYLLVVVPLIIMLGTLKTNPITVWICLALTVSIFLLCLFWPRLKNKSFKLTQGRELIYNLYFAVITGLCVFFPILLQIIVSNSK